MLASKADQQNFERPLLINRNLNLGFSKYRVRDLSGFEKSVTSDWFVGQHKINKLIISTKSYQVIGCIQALTPYLTPNCSIILLHNGLGIQQEAEIHWPHFQFYFASSTEGVWKESSDKIIHAGLGATVIGQQNLQAPDWWSQEFATLRGFQWDQNILNRLHLKVAINSAINPLTILYECQNGSLIDQGSKQAMLSALCKESNSVLSTAGYPISNLEEIVIDVALKTGANFSSSYQDWKSNRKTEINNMNGYIQALAKRYGLPTPTHDTVMSSLLNKATI